MAHVATDVPPFRPLYTASISERHSSERACDPAGQAAPTATPPDLEGAYGIITGMIFGLLAWIAVLLPALYFLL